MESANLHHHHQHDQQEQLVDDGSSSSIIPVATPTSCYGVADNYAWTHNTIILNTNNFNHDVSGAISNSRQKNVTAPHNPMIQDFNFTKWTSGVSPSNDYQVERIKEEEIQPSSLKKFTAMLNSADSSLSSMNYIKNGQQKVVNNDLSEKLMLKTLTSDYHMNPHEFSAREAAYYYDPQSLASLQHGAVPSRGNFSQIYPSVNISNLSSSTSCLDMKTQPLDLLSTARSSQGICQPSSESICMLEESRISCGLDHARHVQSTSRPSCSPNKISPVNNRGGETKRPGSGMEPKVAQSAPKKSRSDTRTPCPTIKVRKEKLGDRIAALQQLVAPFGKTDTASVLMEAIGYIKFLTNQVETLSVPYIKSSRKKTSRSLHGGSKEVEGNCEPKCDLRSRGLCLVPLSCMSYVAANEGVNGGFWPNP